MYINIPEELKKEQKKLDDFTINNNSEINNFMNKFIEGFETKYPSNFKIQTLINSTNFKTEIFKILSFTFQYTAQKQSVFKKYFDSNTILLNCLKEADINSTEDKKEFIKNVYFFLCINKLHYFVSRAKRKAETLEKLHITSQLLDKPTNISKIQTVNTLRTNKKRPTLKSTFIVNTGATKDTPLFTRVSKQENIKENFIQFPVNTVNNNKSSIYINFPDSTPLTKEELKKQQINIITGSCLLNIDSIQVKLEDESVLPTLKIGEPTSHIKALLFNENFTPSDIITFASMFSIIQQIKKLSPDAEINVNFIYPVNSYKLKLKTIFNNSLISEKLYAEYINFLNKKQEELINIWKSATQKIGVNLILKPTLEYITDDMLLNKEYSKEKILNAATKTLSSNPAQTLSSNQISSIKDFSTLSKQSDIAIYNTILSQSQEKQDDSMCILLEVFREKSLFFTAFQDITYLKKLFYYPLLSYNTNTQNYDNVLHNNMRAPQLTIETKKEIEDLLKPYFTSENFQIITSLINTIQIDKDYVTISDIENKKIDEASFLHQDNKGLTDFMEAKIIAPCSEQLLQKSDQEIKAQEIIQDNTQEIIQPKNKLEHNFEFKTNGRHFL